MIYVDHVESTPYLLTQPLTSRGILPRLLLFLRRRFLCRRLLLGCLFRGSCRLRLGFSFHRSGRLLRLRFSYRQLGRAEGLTVIGDLSYPHGGKRLAMSAQLFVLLFPLVMEDQDFFVTAFLDHLSGDARLAGSLAELAFAAAHAQNIELNVAVLGAELLDPHYVSGRHSILLSTGANHRVHTHSSIDPIPAHTSARG